MSCEPIESVRHAVGLHTRGIICPAEMWYQIASVLTAETTSAVLDAMPLSMQDKLREIYFDRASLPGDEEFISVFKQIARWCGSRSRPLSAGPNGADVNSQG